MAEAIGRQLNVQVASKSREETADQAKDLAAHGLTVLVGSRNLERGTAAAREIGPDAGLVQLDATDQASIAAAAGQIRKELGGLDVLAVLSDVATRLGATQMQVALAGLLERSPNLLAIPGTSSIEHLRENLQPSRLQIPPEAIADLDAISGNGRNGARPS